MGNVYFAEYSLEQKCGHIDIIDNICKSNKNQIKTKDVNDYKIIGYGTWIKCKVLLDKFCK